MDRKEFTQKIKEELLQRGAKMVGVAPVERFESAPVGHHPCDYLPNAKSVIVLVMPIVSGLMDWNTFMEKSEMVPETEVYKRPDGGEQVWSPRTTLRKHIERRCSYEVINMELQTISMYAAMTLEEYGYKSVYLPTTYGMTLSWPGNYIWDFPKMKSAGGPFSHRHAAVAAGLGMFGRNNLFMTERYGSRQRIVSIITEADLEPDPVPEKEICLGDKCNKCVKACPSGAFSEETYEYDIGPVKARVCKMDKEKCRGFYKDSVSGAQCGRECITACPMSRKKLIPLKDK